jgi:hypothetical protein
MSDDYEGEGDDAAVVEEPVATSSPSRKGVSPGLRDASRDDALRPGRRTPRADESVSQSLRVRDCARDSAHL